MSLTYPTRAWLGAAFLALAAATTTAQAQSVPVLPADQDPKCDAAFKGYVGASATGQDTKAYLNYLVLYCGGSSYSKVNPAWPGGRDDKGNPVTTRPPVPRIAFVGEKPFNPLTTPPPGFKTADDVLGSSRQIKDFVVKCMGKVWADARSSVEAQAATINFGQALKENLGKIGEVAMTCLGNATGLSDSNTAQMIGNWAACYATVMGYRAAYAKAVPSAGGAMPSVLNPVESLPRNLAAGITSDGVQNAALASGSDVMIAAYEAYSVGMSPGKAVGAAAAGAAGSLVRPCLMFLMNAGASVFDITGAIGDTLAALYQERPVGLNACAETKVADAAAAWPGFTEARRYEILRGPEAGKVLIWYAPGCWWTVPKESLGELRVGGACPPKITWSRADAIASAEKSKRVAPGSKSQWDILGSDVEKYRTVVPGTDQYVYTTPLYPGCFYVTKGNYGDGTHANACGSLAEARARMAAANVGREKPLQERSRTIIWGSQEEGAKLLKTIDAKSARVVQIDGVPNCLWIETILDTASANATFLRTAIASLGVPPIDAWRIAPSDAASAAGSVSDNWDFGSSGEVGSDRWPPQVDANGNAVPLDGTVVGIGEGRNASCRQAGDTINCYTHLANGSQVLSMQLKKTTQEVVVQDESGAPSTKTIAAAERVEVRAGDIVVFGGREVKVASVASDGTPSKLVDPRTGALVAYRDASSGTISNYVGRYDQNLLKTGEKGADGRDILKGYTRDWETGEVKWYVGKFICWVAGGCVPQDQSALDQSLAQFMAAFGWGIGNTSMPALPNIDQGCLVNSPFPLTYPGTQPCFNAWEVRGAAFNPIDGATATIAAGSVLSVKLDNIWDNPFLAPRQATAEAGACAQTLSNHYAVLFRSRSEPSYRVCILSINPYQIDVVLPDDLAGGGYSLFIHRENDPWNTGYRWSDDFAIAPVAPAVYWGSAYVTRVAGNGSQAFEAIENDTITIRETDDAYLILNGGGWRRGSDTYVAIDFEESLRPELGMIAVAPNYAGPAGTVDQLNLKLDRDWVGALNIRICSYQNAEDTSPACSVPRVINIVRW